MRWIIITAAIALMAWTQPSVHDWLTGLFEEDVDPRAAAAIELRCAAEREAFRDDCAVELQRDFELGVREPESILRRHCTRFSNDWATSSNRTHEVCEKIYGGGIES